MRIESLFTEEIASKPNPMPVVGIDGTDTGETIDVTTFRSKAFIEAHNRAAARSGDPIQMSNPDVVQSLIVSWSFEDDCSKENKIRLLNQAAYLIDQIVAFSHRKSEELFSKKKP